MRNKKIIIKSKSSSPTPSIRIHSKNKSTVITSGFFSRRYKFILSGIILLTIAIGLLFLTREQHPQIIENSNISEIDSTLVKQSDASIASKIFFLDKVNTEGFQYQKDVIATSISLEIFLQGQQIPKSSIAELLLAAKKEDSLQLKKGMELYRFTSEHDDRKFFVYQINKTNYVEIRITPIPSITLHQIPLKTKQKTVAGIVKTTLWEAFEEQQIRTSIILQLEEALKWAVDLHHVQAGDRFKLVYEELWSDNRLIETGKLLAIYFKNQQGEHYAFLINEIQQPDYFDEFGSPVRNTFLMSPLRYGRISSRYNLDRLHPVLKEVKPHFGTDYAAPEGTPVRAVADGTISIASFTKNNGNYIKMRHDATYETQYLHLQKLAPSIKKGSVVKQGQTIGYVGQTGLATGPHVCFRFWKNGHQVDHLKEKLNSANPLSIQEEHHFIAQRDSLMFQLLDLEY